MAQHEKTESHRTQDTERDHTGGGMSYLRFGAPQLAELTQPAQVIWGENDTFGSRYVGRRAAEVIPNAELHVVGGGHGPWFTQSDAIGPILKPFLHTHTVGSTRASEA